MEKDKTILLCFWGHRTNDLREVVENYKNIFKNYKIDFLISTWEDVNTDGLNFKYIIKNPPITQYYLDTINFPYTNQLKYHRHHPVRLGIFAQFFHSHVISNFIKNNELKYDVLIKTRSDLFFLTNFEFDFNKDKVYLCENLFSPLILPEGGKPIISVNDQFICGKFDYTLNAFYSEKLEDYYDLIDNSFNPEHVLYQLLNQKNISYTEFYCYKYILLPDRVIKNDIKRKIYQISMFNNELDLLELSLEESYNYIDKFVIVESTKTHSGEDKELVFLKNQNRFEKYKDKIIHFVCEYNSNIFDQYKKNIENIFGLNDYILQTSWIRENFQRDYPILYGNLNFSEEDLILILDIDEVINVKSLINFINTEKSIEKPYRFEMDYLHYYLNTNLYFTNSNVNKKWYYPTLIKYSNLKNYQNSLSTVRIRCYSEENIIKDGGWHFGYLMDNENIYKKIKTFTHHDEDRIKKINKTDINTSISDLSLFYDTTGIVKLKEFPFEFLPHTIKNNKEKWKKYFWHKKDLIIIGCHPNSAKNENILKECINSLSFEFDIALVSHFPIKEEIQKMVKYVIYDKENESINLGSLLIWEKNDLFDYQIHIKNKKDYSYSVLKNILNGIYFLKNKYTSFFYIENDCIFDKEDIDKLKSLKVGNKKSSFFIREDNFIHTLCFYSDINFFLKNISHFLNKDDYLNFCKNEIKYKYPVIENFLYYVFLKNQVLNEINFIKNHPAHFFDKSQIDIVGVPLNEYDYPIYLVSLKNENRLFLLYLNKRTTKFDKDKKLLIYLDDTHLFDLDVGTYNFWCEIFPYNEIFSISVNGKSQTFNKTDLYNDKLNNFIFFKNQ